MKNKTFYLLLFTVFLLSSLAIGFLIGGYNTQEKWKDFYEEKEKEIEKYCSCDYSAGSIFNFTPAPTNVGLN